MKKRLSFVIMPSALLSIFIFLLTIGCSTGDSLSTPDETIQSNHITNTTSSLRKPVIFSYSHPWGSDVNPNTNLTDSWFMDFSMIRLSSANIVEGVEPNKYKSWRSPSHLVLSRTGVEGPGITSEELVAVWEKAISKDGIDGISVDELISKRATPSEMAQWINAIKEIRHRYPDKILAFWCAGIYKSQHQELLKTLRDFADFIIPEIYYRESSSKNYKESKDPFPRFARTVEGMEEQAPGIKEKILIGLGTVQTASWGYDDMKTIDYGEFLAKQIEVCASDPRLTGIAGIAIYAPKYLNPATLSMLNEAIIKNWNLHY